MTRCWGSRAGPGGDPDAAQTGAEQGIEGAGGQAEELGAGVPDDPAELGEDGEAEALGPGAAVLVVEGGRLEDLEQVEGQDLQAQPGGVGAELVGRVDAGGQLVLEDVVDVLDRAGLAALPGQQRVPSVSQSLVTTAKCLTLAPSPNSTPWGVRTRIAR